MRVLMLGWEFPPFISGGLGTACYGLTRALSQQGAEVVFVLPKPVRGDSEHVQLLGTHHAPGAGQPEAETYQLPHMDGVTFKAVPSEIRDPYLLSYGPGASETAGTQTAQAPPEPAPPDSPRDEAPEAEQAVGPEEDDRVYEGDVIEATERYAQRCMRIAADEPHDVIHAHDWMTFPAGMQLAARSGRPLLVHVHSTEHDRTEGDHAVNPHIIEIERRGMHAAQRVICVSHLTANVCIHRYGVPAEKVEVVYNGIEAGPRLPHREPIRSEDRIVLFLGRITAQKGPEFFLSAAGKVLQKVPNAKFVMAGAGDRVGQTMEQAERMGIAEQVVFTGFLRGGDVERVFRTADVYVMPSVSEPFGIAPLEAIRHDVPVIISRSSGVAEVLEHALKVDFWDTDEMANKIIAVLRHPPLSRTLRDEADLELRSLTWDGAAGKCLRIYEDAIEAMSPEAGMASRSSA